MDRRHGACNKGEDAGLKGEPALDQLEQRKPLGPRYGVDQTGQQPVRIGATTKAERLGRWLAAVEHFYSGRILAFGIEEARVAGDILDRARAHNPGFEDITIAATAGARGLTVLTANERHFAPLGVPLINPLKQLPPSPEESASCAPGRSTSGAPRSRSPQAAKVPAQFGI